jgi:NitT/TauT family transport system ATP-binding protein
VRALIDEVYGLMTLRPVREAAYGRMPDTGPIYRLPDTDVTRIEGVLDLLAEPPFNGRADLPHLAEETELSDDELFPTYEALSLLGLAHVETGDITITALGARYAHADHTERKQIFGQQLLSHVPLAKRIREQLEQEPTGAAPEKPFLDLLQGSLEEEEAKRALEIAVEWGRYGEVYEYDYHTGRLKMPEE